LPNWSASKKPLSSKLVAQRTRFARGLHAAEARELQSVYNLRFLRLCRSIALAHRLRANGPQNVRARFTRLLAAEAKSLLPPQR
jgi:hypothetical protein